MLRQIAEKCEVSTYWLVGLTNARARTPSVVDELGLTEEAVDAIADMDKNVCAVLSLFAEQESFAGISEKMVSVYINGKSYCADPRQHILQRISDFFNISTNKNKEYVRSSSGEIFLVDLTMLLKLKAEYRKKNGL